VKNILIAVCARVTCLPGVSNASVERGHRLGRPDPARCRHHREGVPETEPFDFDIAA